MNFSCYMLLALLPGLKPRNAALVWNSSKNANQTPFCARFGQPGLIPHDQLRSPSCCESCLSYGSYGSYGNALQDRKVRHLENMRKTSPSSHPGNTFRIIDLFHFLGYFCYSTPNFPKIQVTRRASTIGLWTEGDHESCCRQTVCRDFVDIFTRHGIA